MTYPAAKEGRPFIWDFYDRKAYEVRIVPRPYPSFLPYYLEHNITSAFNIQRIESLQFSIGPELPKEELDDSHEILIIRVSLE